MSGPSVLASDIFVDWTAIKQVTSVDAAIKLRNSFKLVNCQDSGVFLESLSASGGDHTKI